MAIRYTVSGVTSDNTNLIDFDLRYGAITTVGQTVRYTGTNFIDAVFIRPGLVYDLTNTGVKQDKIYFTGNLADYTLSADGSNLTLTRTVGNQTETVTLSVGTLFTSDNLIFANGVVSSFALITAVKNTTTLPTPVATTETSLAPVGAAAPNATLSANVRAQASSNTGEVFGTVKPGIKLLTIGGAGVDTVYVADGMHVDAVQLGGGTDLIYMRGKWSDYSKVVDTISSIITFTRNVVVEGKAVTETVVVNKGNVFNFDRLIFADGAVSTFNANTALTTSLSAPITAVTGYNGAPGTGALLEVQVLP